MQRVYNCCISFCYQSNWGELKSRFIFPKILVLSTEMVIRNNLAKITQNTFFYNFLFSQVEPYLIIRLSTFIYDTTNKQLKTTLIKITIINLDSHETKYDKDLTSRNT